MIYLLRFWIRYIIVYFILNSSLVQKGYQGETMKKYNKLFYILIGSFAILFLAMWGFLIKGSTDGQKPDTEIASSKETTQEKVKEDTLRVTSETTEKTTAKEETETPTVTPTVEPTEIPSSTPVAAKRIIVIDAAHQEKSDLSTEPIGPGASEKNTKVTSGTYGIVSGLAEHELTLTVAKQLQKALEAEGYQVVMVRTKSNVNISERKRAEIANKAKADIFLSIHADGSENHAASGAMAICPTKQNPYCAKIYKKSKNLSKTILSTVVEQTGCKNRGVWENDSMSVVNWSEVPVSVLELGFMTNKEEDSKLATTSYQKKLVKGMVAGVKKYFGE